MKKFMENIKANKLRSALIGCCAFLFGFISVSIFNSVGDTYAVTYTCSTGWYPVGGNNERCCPEEWTYNSATLECTKTSGLSQSECENTYGGRYAQDGVGQILGACYLMSAKGIPATSTTYSIVFYPNSPLSGTHGAVWTNNGSGYIREGSFVTTCTTIAGESKCSINSLPTISRTAYLMYGWSPTSDCTSIANLSTPLSLERSLAMYACWSEKAACYACGSGGKGSYKYGKFANASQCGLYSTSLSEAECEAKNTTTNKPVDPEEPVNPSTGNNGSTGTNDAGQSYTVANVKNYYAITYNLDGGQFIDGSTKRTEYMTGNNALGNMKTNPIKEGHVFIEWQYNGNTFDFSKPLDELGLKYENNDDKYIDIELKAVWEEHTDETLYCENENAVLDYSTNNCYTVLKEDTSKKIYTHTTYSYTYEDGAKNERFCYAYNDLSTGDKTPGGIYWRNETNIEMVASGKQNKTDGVYAGYEGNDYWISSETCRIAAPCYVTTQSTDYPAESCEVTYSAILYHEEDALVKEIEYIEPEGPEEPEEPDTPSNGEEKPDDKPSNDKTDEDLTDEDAGKLQTGDALIILAWIVGLGALGYTAYYFIKRKREN